MMTPAACCRAACLALSLALSAGTACAGPTSTEARIFAASGVAAAKIAPCVARLDQLGEELERLLAAAGAEPRAEAIQAFLHARILRGRYEPGASDLGEVLEGGPFNCVSATVLYVLLAERCGLKATAMSVPGHVWCRVEGPPLLDIECTSREWFSIRAKYAGVPTSQVSPAMARHRRRAIVGRPLDERKLLAVLHYNRGVALIEAGQLHAAAWQNLQAVALDADCRPARENLAAVSREISRPTRPVDVVSALILWSLDRATAAPALAGR